MRKIWKLFLIILLLAFIIGLLLTVLKKNKQEVLSSSAGDSNKFILTPTLTITPNPSPTFTPTPTPSPTPSPSPTPTLILPPKIAPELIHSYIERFSAQYSVDPNVLRHLAVCESGFDPLAINGKYVGLYQFAKVTWQNNRIIMGEDINPDLRLNAEEATQTAAYLVSLGKKNLWPNCYP